MITQKALTSFYGIGPNVCARLCAKHSIHPMAKLASLQTPKLNELQADMAKMTLENDLRKELRDNIGRLRELGTYRGRRHAQVCMRPGFVGIWALMGVCVGPAGERTEDEKASCYCKALQYAGEERLSCIYCANKRYRHLWDFGRLLDSRYQQVQL